MQDHRQRHIFWVTVIFTAISIARGWCVRRLFNRLHAGRRA